jgi:exopolyphosphatase/guanosine-5'-triphosphate,3'-diphosphate pyrophosphatase
MSPRAAIDIGTNSVRLLVRDGDRDLDRRSVITRVGEGVDRTRRLEPAAIERTVAALLDFDQVLRDHAVGPRRVVATSAARDAVNRDELFSAVQRVLGVEPDLLSGDEEARLSFTGAVKGLDEPAGGAFVVVDIGGGSTEFAVGTGEPSGTRSVDVGSVRLTETELHHDPPRPEELTNAIGVVQDELEGVVRALPEAADGRLVGVGGTVTTVAAVEIGLVPYDRTRVDKFRLTREAAEDVFRTLATESLSQRVHNPGLQPERADIIVGGCCILVGIMRGLGCDALIVRDADLLDALVDELR